MPALHGGADMATIGKRVLPDRPDQQRLSQAALPEEVAEILRITHLLDQFPYEDVPLEKVTFGKRNSKGAYDDDEAIADRRFVPAVF